ncbi:PA2778 family cysteine peptidase [Alkalilimnicola ehrlichii]|uniref:PA2778 family cysteine peptidase n=1 Tax=Alkalilimnicola ehrlichii TaxID=351052 RepID=UPI0015F251EB|nr:PA2778 family cysteine peptidase [Alkalilimnicola ehrlichii]
MTKTAINRFVFVAIVAILAGCASLDRQAPGELAPPPEPIELADVPFFPQTEHQCGPAALATVLAWSGVETDAETLSPQLYIPAREGTLQHEIVAQARQHDRLAYQIPAEPQALLAELAAGNPVLVLQNLGLNWLPYWHYAVVVGYDPEADHFILRSGTHKRHTTARRTFDRTWARSNRWAIVAVEPTEVPASAAPSSYLAAAFELEQAGRVDAAQHAYRSGLKHWPNEPNLALALGNSYYSDGDVDMAIDIYQHAIARGAYSGPLYNNLATALAEREQWAAAEAAARSAIALNDAHREHYRKTLTTIRCRQSNSCQP